MRPLWWAVAVLLALLGNADTVRDWFFPEHKDQEILSFFSPSIHWSAVAWIGVVLLVLEGGYRAWSKEREAVHELERNIQDLTTPKLSIKSNADCLIERSDSATFRKFFLIVANQSAIPITGMQVYCDKIVVTSPEPPVARREDYRRLILGGPSLRKDLAPNEQCLVSIVREMVDWSSTGGVVDKHIEFHVPLKCVSDRTLYGREFLIDLIVHAKEEVVPRRASYVFGWRDSDEFFFESRGQFSTKYRMHEPAGPL